MLSAKHREFVNQLFLCNMNQVDAYLKVYPKSSYDAARANSARLIANDNIRIEVSHRLKESQMTSDEVIKRLTDMARNDVGPFVDVEKPTDLRDEKYQGKTHLIKKIKTTRVFTKSGDEIVTTELELYDAKSALDSLAKYHNLFRDTQVNIDIDYSTLTDEQLRRIANGEDPLTVTTSQGESRTGTEAANGETEEPMAD